MRERNLHNRTVEKRAVTYSLEACREREALESTPIKCTAANPSKILGKYNVLEIFTPAEHIRPDHFKRLR